MSWFNKDKNDEENQLNNVDTVKEVSKKKKLLTTWVFDRKWEDKISEKKFFSTIWIVLAWWLWLTAFLAYLANQLWYQPTIIELIIWFVVSILWIFIAVKSDNPIVSFIGYNLVVIPLWFELGPILDAYSPEVIQKAMWMTALIAIIMWLLWATHPDFFKKLGTVLFISLLVLIVLCIVQLFIPWLDFWWVDYVSAWIFTLYIWYDMYRATALPKTYDNAIDLCIDFYLDIINLFLDLLEIFWRRR